MKCVVLRVDPLSDAVVALESTVIAHGLPHPVNLETAKKLQNIVKDEGAVPAVIGVISGEVVVGLNESEIEKLANGQSVKVGVRELPYVMAKGLDGDTTVSATLRVASIAGIDVFVTGGIGGFHRDAFDISQDLYELSRTRGIVISAGAKSILDLEKTVELLETLGVIVVGYKTKEFPAFYTSSSGIPLNMWVDDVNDIVKIYESTKKINYQGAILVANPIPISKEIPRDELEDWTERALEQAKKEGVRGKALTPYLLEKLSEFSSGRTLEANIELLISNARLGAKIALKLKEFQGT